MEVLFLGLLFKEEDEEKILINSKVGINNSTNTFQWNIIKGICSDASINLRILNSIPCGNYPLLYNRLFVKSNDWNYEQNFMNNKEIGFINFYFTKHFIRLKSYMKEVKKWINDTQAKERCIIVYDMYVPFMKIIKWISKRYPDVKTNLIIGDLPNEYSHNYEKYKNTLKGFVLNQRGKKSLDLIQYFDSFVFLTKHMSKPLNIKDKPYIVIEGIVDKKRNLGELIKLSSNKKIIMYAGTLNKQFGIDTLLEAFNGIIDNKYELWICGSGDMNDFIKTASERDNRIKHYGYVSKSQLLEMEKEIIAYVNPRKNLGAYTKYSFPSKTIDYLASGKPIIMYKLDGIPDDYDDYLFYVKDNSVTSLRNKIIEVCEKSNDEFYKMGVSGQNFIKNHKNNILQSQRIIKLLKSISSETL